MRKFMVLLFMIIAINAYTGDYVTYVDPKTGVRFYGDSVPQNAPKVPVEVREMKGNVSSGGTSSGWNEAAKGIAPKVPAAVTVKPTVTQKPGYVTQEQIGRLRSLEREQAMHRTSPPRRPDSGPAFRDFNRATNQWGQYDAKVFEWRAQERDMQKQYNSEVDALMRQNKKVMDAAAAEEKIKEDRFKLIRDSNRK